MSRVFVFLLGLVLSLPLMAFETTAPNAYVIDTSTGTIMFDKGAHVAKPPASMSKLMTIALTFKALKDGTITMDTMFLVSQKAWAMGGSKMFVEQGAQVSIEELIQGVVVQSGNDACVVLAEGLAGSEEKFAELMNQHARDLGLENSSFGNASGWPDPRQRMSAHDLAKLAYYIEQTYPEYWHYFAEPEYTYNNITQANRNPLLGRVEGADGLKTGHTEEAGYGLVGSVKRQGRRVIFVLMGMDSEAERAREAERVATWALSSFAVKSYYQNNAPITKAKTWLADKAEVGLTTPGGFKTLEPIAGSTKTTIKLDYEEPISAPLEAGSQVGTLTVISAEFPEYSLPLVTSEALERGGFVRRFGDVSQSLIERVASEVR